MAARYSRRQATRFGAFVRKNQAGVYRVEARPRGGKSDFLLQLYETLRTPPGPLPAFLALRGRLPAAEDAERVLAQWLATGGGAGPLASLDRTRIAAREDGAVWQEPLALLDNGFTTQRFLAMAALVAERRGPLCLLLDDCTPELLAAAAAIPIANLTVVASAPESPAGVPTIRIEEFTPREAVLMMETAARSLAVPFSGSAAEPFAASVAADAFVLQAVVERAALRGRSLTSENDFVAVYVDEICEGSLAAYFDAQTPGAAGSSARRFVLELLMEAGRAGGTKDAEVHENWLTRWRHRAPVDDLLTRMQHAGWVRARGHGWTVRAWPAAQHWAAAQLYPASLATGALHARLTDALARSRDVAARSAVSARASSALRQADAEAWRGVFPDGDGASSPAYVEVEELKGGTLFLCFCAQPAPRLTAGNENRGREPGAKPGAAAPQALVVALPAEATPFRAALREFDDRLATLLAADPSGIEWSEKVVVARDPREADALLRALGNGQPGSWRAVPFDAFNRAVAASSNVSWESTGADIVLKLPADPNVELVAVRVLDHLVERRGWGESFAAQARMALVEACLNAIAHVRANPDLGPDAFVEVRLAASEEALDIVVQNPGVPFQPDQEVAGSAVHRGHGLKMMRTFMDEVRFSGDLHGTSVYMRKRAGTRAEKGSSAYEDITT